MHLSILPGLYAVSRFDPTGKVPDIANDNGFYSVTKTPDETSVVCLEDLVPTDAKTERGWKIIAMQGPLDFALTGVLASVASPLAEAKVSIFAISTYDTDYILVKEIHLKSACEVLSQQGFKIIS